MDEYVKFKFDEHEPIFIYDIYVGWYSKERYIEFLKDVRRIVTDDNIVEPTEEDEIPVLRIRCTWDQFNELMFRWKLEKNVMWM